MNLSSSDLVKVAISQLSVADVSSGLYPPAVNTVHASAADKVEWLPEKKM